MFCYYSDVLFKIIKIVVIARLITYGTSNLTRYLNYKHGKRFHTDRVNERTRKLPGKTDKLSRMKKYVPYTIGFGLFGVYISTRFSPNFPIPPTKLELKVYSLLPLRVLSRIWGSITSINLPVFMRPKVYSFYANSFGVNMEECAIQDLHQYKNLSEFFVRPLKEECRPIDRDRNCVASPADGRVLTCGKITDCQVDQVKGVTYSLPEFLGIPTWKDPDSNFKTRDSLGNILYRKVKRDSSGNEKPKELLIQEYLPVLMDHGKVIETDDLYLNKLKENMDTDLYQCVIYLAPGDYHRFHSPVSWTVYFRRHFYGNLLSVNPAIASWISNLFSINERAAYIGAWRHGFFSLTAVGATNVGSIKVAFDPLLKTNVKWKNRKQTSDFYFGVKEKENDYDNHVVEKHVYIRKGELFGEFRLGSTIVLIFEAPKNFKFNVKSGDRIKYGERLGQFS